MKFNFALPSVHYSSLVLLLGAIYFSTLLPGPGYSGDTVKFQFIGYILGTPHETGYPTYVILNYIFTSLFPFGSLAFKANLLSAICSIGAMTILFTILRKMEIDPWISFIVTLTFGLGYTVWSQSLVAEVYSLNLLFFSLIVYSCQSWHKERRDIFLYLACGLYAFSFGNHLTMISFLPAIIFFLWKTDPRVYVDAKRISFVTLLILLGALQYLYIIWRTNDPATPYLEMSAHDLKGVWSALSGGQFSHLLFGFSISWMLTERLPALMLYMTRELMFFLPFILAGFFASPQKNITTFLLIAVAGNFLFCLAYAIYDIFVYLIPSYFVFAIFGAHGLRAIAGKLKSRIWISAFLAFIPLATGLINYSAVNQRTNFADDRRVRELLALTDKNALIVCPNYHYAMMFWYHVLTQEWQGRNLHIAFYHDLHFPAREISDYLSDGRRFFVPVSRDSIPAGLKAYLFLDSFVVQDAPSFEPKKPFSGQSPGARQSDYLRHKTALEKVDVRLTELATGFYQLTLPSK